MKKINIYSAQFKKYSEAALRNKIMWSRCCCMLYPNENENSKNNPNGIPKKYHTNTNNL